MQFVKDWIGFRGFFTKFYKYPMNANELGISVVNVDLFLIKQKN